VLRKKKRQREKHPEERVMTKRVANNQRMSAEKSDVKRGDTTENRLLR
jgi:hypothetical protein